MDFNPAPPSDRKESLVNAMSVDVEDYFQVSAFEGVISRASWDTVEHRVPSNIDRILDLFAEHGIKATFFTLGWVAERFPEHIRRIADAGHEVASHGMEHVRVVNQDAAEFLRDAGASKRLLEDVTGKPVTGYRAASYSIGAQNLWAFEVLNEIGFKYSSSVYPIHHDLYGMPDAPRFSFRPDGMKLIEIPVTTVQMAGKKLPCGGGGFFRLLPYQFFKFAINRVNTVDRRAAIFYFHPWEIDPDQPRVEGASLKSRFRHYLNLKRMEPRLRRLLTDFKWDRMDRVFLGDDS